MTDMQIAQALSQFKELTNQTAQIASELSNLNRTLKQIAEPSMGLPNQPSHRS
jgi:ABC-type transporter Mla subunit MlaD